MKPKQIYTYIKILAIIGLLLSVYLLWQQFFRPAFQPCTINSFINCDAVISGPVAKTFGITTPLFCLGIGYIELVQLRVICPICIGCQVIMIIIFALAIKLHKLK